MGKTVKEPVHHGKPVVKKRPDTHKKTVEVIRKQLTDRIGSKAMAKVVII